VAPFDGTEAVLFAGTGLAAEAGWRAAGLAAFPAAGRAFGARDFPADFLIALALLDLDGLPDFRAGCFLAIRVSSPP
jgi:hypothetical protein